MSASHKIYGIPQVINTANYVYFLAYQELFFMRKDALEAAESSADTPGQKRLISVDELDRVVTC